LPAAVFTAVAIASLASHEKSAADIEQHLHINRMIVVHRVLPTPGLPIPNQLTIMQKLALGQDNGSAHR
jgi:hypothetical protein